MNTRIFCLGEVLIDEIGENRHIGGAPMNTAVHLHRMGTETFFMSSVGSDLDGDMIRDFLTKENLNEGLSIHPRLPTGLAKAFVHDSGEKFEIIIPSAWNEIIISRGTEKKISDLTINDPTFVYFGSLAMHFENNRRLFDHLISTLTQRTSVPPTVFLDINIRRPFIDRNLILWCLSRTSWLKLNDQELELFQEWDLTDNGTEEERLRSIYQRYKLHGVILTKGEKGSSFFSQKTGYLMQPASPVKKIADTIGAGDAFCSAFIFGLCSNYSVSSIMQIASKKAAEICSIHGAV